MDVINFDNNSEEKQSKHHFLVPDCHYMIVAPTGGGKTNLLCNMLLRWMKYDSLTIYTINQNQKKYQMLSELFDDCLKLPEEVIPVEQLDDDTDKVVIFDDIKIDKKNMNMIKEYFSLSRNKNCNSIYLTQSYYDVPKYIRRNTGCFILFNGLDNRDIHNISSDHCTSIGKEQFMKCYQLCCDNKYAFMVFHRDAKCVPEMYRKGFDRFYIPDH